MLSTPAAAVARWTAPDPACVTDAVQKAHRKALDVINSVGLGETLLKLIERRQRMDIWITYGGMVSSMGVLCARVHLMSTLSVTATGFACVHCRSSCCWLWCCCCGGLGAEC